MPRMRDVAEEVIKDAVELVCLHCGGLLRKLFQPTQEQWNAAYPQLAGFPMGVEPVPLPFDADTMNPKHRDTHGALHRCTACGAPFRLGATVTPAGAVGEP